MARFYHRISACDGSSYRIYASEAKARAAVEKFCGYPMPEGRSSMVDDYGTRHTIEEVSDRVKSGRTMEAIERAYGARECGTATKRDLALLAKHYY